MWKMNTVYMMLSVLVIDMRETFFSKCRISPL